MFSKKKIELTFHTCESKPFADILSPAKATSMYPEWFKKISPKTDYPSMRSCPGYIEFFKKSIAIPLWRDFEITYRGSEIHNVVTPFISPDDVYHYVQHHHPDQWGRGFTNQPHLKLMNPWLITCNTLTPFMISEASWHKKGNDYNIPQGVVEYRLNTSCHVNMFLNPSNQEKTLLLEAGEPIVYLTPLEDVEVDIKIKEISEEEWRRLLNYRFTFKNNYRKILNLFGRNNA
jgi:hypothetical protein